MLTVSSFWTLHASATAVRKTALSRRFYTKTSILPRQARDKHRENTQKREQRVFCTGTCALRRVCRARKRQFLGHLYIKCIILPRQARDKHRENSKTMPFSQVRAVQGDDSGAAPGRQPTGLSVRRRRKRSPFSFHFYTYTKK